MLIGIMADSHDNMPRIEQAVRFFNQRKVEVVLHAGDFIAPFVVNKLKGLSCNLVGVFGNNDGEREGLKKRISEIGEIHSPPFSFTWLSKKILLVHNFQDLKEKKIDVASFDIVVYGHTHHAKIGKEGKSLLINPGECGAWLTGKSTVALLDLKTMKAWIEEIKS